MNEIRMDIDLPVEFSGRDFSMGGEPEDAPQTDYVVIAKYSIDDDTPFNMTLVRTSEGIFHMKIDAALGSFWCKSLDNQKTADILKKLGVEFDGN